MELTEPTRMTAAILFFSLVTVEAGGQYMLRLLRGSAAATPFQLSFARAGHAHAGVLLVLSLLGLMYADAVGVDGLLGRVARLGVPVAALLMPAGFFFSSMGRGRTHPSRWIVLVHIGALSLAAGLIALGIGMLA